MTTSPNNGFEISIDLRRHLLRIRLWGLWDAEFAKKYRYALTEKIEEIMTNGKEWYAFADFTRFYPRSEEVQHIIREQLDMAKERGMRKIVYLGKKPAIQLRLNTIFYRSTPQEYSFADSDEEAIQWLLSESSYT